jgi:hypothetical protein
MNKTDWIRQMLVETTKEFKETEAKLLNIEKECRKQTVLLEDKADALYQVIQELRSCQTPNAKKHDDNQEIEKLEHQRDLLVSQAYAIREAHPDYTALHNKHCLLNGRLLALSAELQEAEWMQSIGTNRIILYFHTTNTCRQGCDELSALIFIDGKEQKPTTLPLNILKLDPGMHSLCVTFKNRKEEQKTDEFRFSINDTIEYFCYNITYNSAISFTVSAEKIASLRAFLTVTGLTTKDLLLGHSSH